MTEPTEVEQILSEIIAEHGLVRLADKAVARALAESLIAEPPNPSLIVSLRTALPPRVDAAAPSVTTGLEALDEEELTLLGSLKAKLDGQPDPHRHLHRLSALRQRCQVLEAANVYLRDQLRAARTMPRDGLQARATGPSAPEPTADASNIVQLESNGLPGQHRRGSTAAATVARQCRSRGRDDASGDDGR
jgi:hypothetical protein